MAEVLTQTAKPNPPKKFGRELLIRTASAVVLAPVALWCVYAGSWPYLLLISAVLFAGLYEWLRLTKISVLGVIGIAYLATNLVAFLTLRSMPEIGRDLTFYVLLSVWAVDIGAYFAGRLIGGPKLAPRFSPSKTWAGLFGGMIASALIGYAWAFFSGARYPETCLILGLVIGIAAQIGDILESALKRKYGVKDSGNLIPGHGGVLDRVDGLLLAVPLFVIFQKLIGENWGWW